MPNGAKEVGVGRGLGQRPSWLARKPLIRRHTQPCRDDPVFVPMIVGGLSEVNLQMDDLSDLLLS